MHYSNFKSNLNHLLKFSLKFLGNNRAFFGYAILLITLFSGNIAWHYWNISQESDVGCFMAIGNDIRHGKLLYSEVWDNKAPGIFFLHAFFQTITSGNIHYPALFTAFFSASFMLFLSIMVMKLIQNPIRYILLPFGFSVIYLTIFQWEYFFESGFTEQIGAYFLYMGFVLALVLLNHSNRKGEKVLNAGFVLSGISIGAAFLIKEPFVFSYLAIILIFLISKNPLKWKWFAWMNAGMAIFPFLFLVYLLWNSIFIDYLKYVQFAFEYSDKGMEQPFMSQLKNTLNIQLENLNSDEPYLLNVFEFSGILLLVNLISFKNTSNFQYRNFHIGLMAILLCQIPFFMISGDVVYNHYFIPLLMGLAVIPTCLGVVYLLRFEQQMKTTIGVLFAYLLVLVGYRCFKEQIQPFRGKSLTVDQETQILEEKGLANTHCYIDDQSAGRFYYYLDANSDLPFPCPYYVYFLFPENEKGYEIIRQNNERFQREFRKNPPQFILSKQKLSIAFDYNQFHQFVNANYQITDSLIINQTTYFVRKRNQ